MSGREKGATTPSVPPKDARKLHQALKLHGHRDMVQVGMGNKIKSSSLKLGVEAKHPELLMSEFDHKLAEIQAMLSRYNNESKGEAAPERAASGRGAGGKGLPGAGAPSAGAKKERSSSQQVTEEEAYLSSKVQRRLKAVWAGASSSLTNRVHEYRGSEAARAELQARVRQHLLAKAQEAEQRSSVHLATHNFIRSNRLCLRNDPSPYISKVLSLAPPDSPSPSHLPGHPSPPTRTRPHTADPALARPIHAVAWEQPAATPHPPSPPHPSDPAPSLHNVFLTTGSSPPDGSSTWLTSSPLGPPLTTLHRVTGPPTTTLPRPQPGAPPSPRSTPLGAHPPAAVLNSTPPRVLQLSAAALTRLPPPPRTHAHLLAQNAQSPHSIAAAAEALRGVSRQGAPPAPCDPHALQPTPSSSTSSPPCQARPPGGGSSSSTSSSAGHRAGRASAAVSTCHRGLVRPSTAQGRLGHGPPPPGGQGLGGWVQQPDMPRVVTAWSVRPGSPPELGGGGGGAQEEELSAAVRCSLLPGAEAVERALRLSLTARPASGGSPTRRSDFLAQHRFLCARQQVLAEEVRCRRGEIQEWEESRRLLDGELRAQRQEEEARQKEEARLHLELTERKRAWSGITSLACKLHFIAAELRLDRKLRGVRAVRKAAAVMIASWYKRILLRRRQQELTQLMMRLRRVMKPLLVAKKEQIRVKCAERILTFLEVADASGGYSVSTAVMRYKEKLIRLQRIWRMMTQVRATQRIILLNYFTRFERSVIRRNRREQHHQLDQVRGRPRGQSSGPRRSSLAVGEFASYSGHGRTSRDTSPSGFDLGASSDLGTLSDSLRGSAHLPGSRGPHTPSHYAGGFNASMDSGAAVIVKAGANYSPHGPSLHAPGGALTSALKGASHGRKGAEVMDPLLEAELAQHREPLPLDVKHELVQRALLECRRKFYAQLSTYRTNMELYDAQKPIEELRLRLLRDAGLDPVSHLAKPRKPAMLVLLPKPALKRMLRDGIHLLEEKRLAAQVARRAAVDALWLEKQAQKQGGAACAGTLPAAAGTGAQGQGQGPKGPLALDVVLGALEGVGPDLASGSPLAPLALGPTTHLLPHAYTQGGSAV